MNAMRDPSQALATRWFQKAENDLLNKGFLAWRQMPFAKTHDLPELLKQIKQVAGADAEMLSDHLFLLDPYSVSIRYPQEYEEEPDEAEVQEAVEAAYAVRAWVRSRLKLE